MNVEQFCSASRIVVLAGKGGVGKTTVTAALATAAARAGASVLIVEVEGKSGLAAALGCPPLTYEEQPVRERVRVRTLTPDEALREYLEDRGLHRISRRLMKSGALDVVATAVPGMKDILVLGKVKQLERANEADLILIDAPAAGHAINFLLSPRGLLDAVRVGPVRAQAEDVIELLSDPARCRVALVTLPEETPVNELVDTAFALEDRVGVKLAPVIVNAVPDDLPIDGHRAGGDAAEAGIAVAASEAQGRLLEVAPGSPLLRLAARQGVTFCEHTEVTGIQVTNGHVVAVKTSRGKIAARTVVNAANAWAGSIGRMVGLEFPVEVRRSHLLVTERLPQFLGPVLSTDHYGYFRQAVSGTVLIGFPARPQVGFDRRVTDEAVAQGARRAGWIIPQLKQASLIRSFTGFTAWTPDNLPIAGALSEPAGLFIAAVFCGLGFSIAPAIGELMAELIVTGRTSHSIEHYRPERFTLRPTNQNSL